MMTTALAQDKAALAAFFAEKKYLIAGNSYLPDYLEQGSKDKADAKAPEFFHAAFTYPEIKVDQKLNTGTVNKTVDGVRIPSSMEMGAEEFVGRLAGLVHSLDKANCSFKLSNVSFSRPVTNIKADMHTCLELQDIRGIVDDAEAKQDLVTALGLVFAENDKMLQRCAAAGVKTGNPAAYAAV